MIRALAGCAVDHGLYFLSGQTIDRKLVYVDCFAALMSKNKDMLPRIHYKRVVRPVSI